MKQTIILTAFGTAKADALDSFYTIAERVKSLFPNSTVIWAFTSGMIRTRLTKQNINIPSPDTVVKKCIDSNTPYLVLPFQIVPGSEYENMCSTLTKLSLESAKRIATPLINNKKEIDRVLDLLLQDRKNSDAILLTAHGNGNHPSDVLYTKIDRELQSRSHLFRCATLDAKPSLEDVIDFYVVRNIKQINIIPLFFSAGKHLKIDIAGEQRGSWASQFKKRGIAVEIEIVPLNQKEQFIDIWIEKLVALNTILK